MAFIVDNPVIYFGILVNLILIAEESGKVYMCSETPNPVKCGISRIWVLAEFR